MSLKLNFCCFCLPLRPGLLIWGYLALVITYISILKMLFKIEDILYEFRYFDPMSFIVMTLSLGMSFVHFLFYIVLLAGLHKKSRGLLEVFYGYNIIIMILLSVITFLYAPVRAYRFLHLFRDDDTEIYLALTIFILLLTMACQFYLTIVVRSFISKLEDDKDCSSPVYHTEDPGCLVHIYKEKDYCDC